MSDDRLPADDGMRQDPEWLKRVTGVGDVELFGAKDFGMRIWIDPDKLKSRNLTTDEILDAINEQNIQVAAGQIGAPPAPQGQVFQYTVNTLGRLVDVEQFEDIILKISEDGRILRLKDVARVELGAKAYTTNAKLNGSPSFARSIPWLVFYFCLVWRGLFEAQLWLDGSYGADEKFIWE